MEMKSDFDRVADEIQASIMEEARRTYSEKVIQRWLYPRNVGPIEHPDGHARFTGPCGDTMEIFLQVRGNRIVDAKFLTDGCATTAFNVSVFTGVLAAIGLVLHEFPEGIVTFVLLERGGFSRRKSAIYAFLAAAISTPLGTLVSYPLINTIRQSTLGTLLAISAGTLVYVGASHLLPAVERENKRYSVLLLTAGVLVAVVIIMSKG